MSNTKAVAVFFIPWLHVCTYASAWLMYDRPPLFGAWCLTWLFCLGYLVVGRALDRRGSVR